MANGQIDIIVAKKAIEEIDLTNKKLEQTNNAIIEISKNARDLNNTFAQVQTPKDLETRLKSNAKAQKEVNIQAKESERLNRALITSRERLAQASSEENAELQRNRKELNQVNATLRSAGRAYDALSNKRNQAKKDLQDLIVRGRKASQTQKEFNKELQIAQSRFDKYDQKIRKADKATKDFTKNVGNYKSAFGGALNAMKAFLPALGAFTALQIGREVFNLVVELDGLNKALKQVTETSSIFVQAKGFLGDLAEEAGVEIQGLTKAYTKFLAAAKTTNLTTEQTQNIFRQTAKAGAILGLSTDDINGSFRALEQILSKGKVQAEEIRGQLGERLPGAFQILAKSMGLTTAELSKQLELGNVLSEEVLPGFAEELEKTYGLENVDRVETLTSEINRLKNEWVLLIEDIEGGEGVLSSFFSSAISGASNFLSIVRDINTTSDGFGDFILNLARLSQPGQAGAIAAEAQAARIEKERLELAKEAFEILKQTTDESAAKLLVDNLSITQLKQLIEESKKKKKIDEESNEVLGTSINSLKEIIKENNAIIASTTDTSVRNKLLEENQLLEKQVKLLMQAGRLVKEVVPTTTTGVTPISGGGSGDINTGQPLGVEVSDVPSLFETALDEVVSFREKYETEINKAIDVTNAFFDNRIERIQQDIDKNNEYFDAQIALAEGNEEQQQRLEQERIIRNQELEKKKRKELQKQAIFQKAIASTNIIIETAQAVAASIKASPLTGGLPWSAINAALGAAQLATVLAQPIPRFAEGGTMDKDGAMLINDHSSGRQEFIERNGEIYTTTQKNAIVSGKKGDKIHKDLDSLVQSQGYDLEAINKAAVMSSILGDSQKLNSIALKDAFNDSLDKYQGQIKKEIKQGFKNVNISSKNTTNFDHSIYRNDTL